MPKFEYDYYAGAECDQFRFLKVPKVFFEDPDYEDLGLEECVLYGFLHEQVAHSKKNGWIDGEGHTYIIRSIESIGKLLRCSEDKARTVLKNLIEFGLIEKKRRGQGKPDLIYVKNFVTKKQEKSYSEKKKDCGKLFSEPEKDGFLSAEKSESRVGKNRVLDSAESVLNETKNNYKNNTETPSIHPDTVDIYKRPLRIYGPNDGLMDDVHKKEKECEDYEWLIRKNLDYENTIRSFKDPTQARLFDDFYNVILDVMFGDTKEYTIHGVTYPQSVVRSRLSKLTADDVMIAMTQYSKYPDKIRNPKKFMISTLYTASISTNAFIENDVQHMLYGGSGKAPKIEPEPKKNSWERNYTEEELEKILGVI